MVFADGVFSDEVYEGTDADSSTTKDYDNVWFNALEEKVSVKERR